MREFPIDLFRAQRTPFYGYDTALLRRTLEEVNRQLRDRPSWQVH